MHEDDFRQDVKGVDVIRWNPTRADDDRRRADNVGDLLGPIIVERLLDETPRRKRSGGRSLLSVGSILQFAKNDDVVWGSGANAKLRPSRLDAGRTLDVRAVRGPLTRILLEAQGIAVPAVFGDPALLLPELFPETLAWADASAKRAGYVLVPNLNDLADFAQPECLSPQGDVWEIVRSILSAELVVGSSLHAIVIAEAYGVPARLVRSPSEHPMKYVDYYAGTGRQGVRIAQSVDEALELGGVSPVSTWSSAPLLQAFPRDLWTSVPADAPEGSRGLAVAVEDVVGRIADAQGDDRAALDELARRVVLGGLAHRSDTVTRSALDRVVDGYHALEPLGVFDGFDDRYDRTRMLARLRLTGDLRRSSLVNRSGYRAVAHEARRAGDDGIVQMTGTLQLPDGGGHEIELRLELADDVSDDRVVVPVQWKEIDPRLGSCWWSAEIGVDGLAEGSYVLIMRIGRHTDAHDIVVQSIPGLTAPRWWLDPHRPYRVDRTARGNAVIHVGNEGEK